MDTEYQKKFKCTVTIWIPKQSEYSGGLKTEHVPILDGCCYSVCGPNHLKTQLGLPKPFYILLLII